MELNQTARAVMDAMSEGITIIDTQGRIVFGNAAYRAFLERELGPGLGSIEGKLLRELRPGARLPEVLKTGKPQLYLTRKEIADFYIVNMYPIYQDGELIGGLSVVTFLDAAYRLRQEVDELEARSKQVLRRINRANGARYTFEDIVAVSEAAREVKALAEKIALTDATVLLEAESGAGKELYAQAIHNASPRREGVFVAINCSNFNAELLDSELFGYVEGAFTGAKKGGKLGLFEAAAGGTLFLDEISEMAMPLQAKLLRALQERRIRPVGGTREIEVDVRVIAACNVDLPTYIKEGKFRKDLYYRLSTFPIHIPPLRERREDIPALARAILEELSHKLRRPIQLTPQAEERLQAHDWPGNVRELRNVLEFSTYLSPTGVLEAEALPGSLAHPPQATTLAQRTAAFQRREIQRTLEKYGPTLEGKRRAAAELGISLSGLYHKLQEGS